MNGDTVSSGCYERQGGSQIVTVGICMRVQDWSGKEPSNRPPSSQPDFWLHHTQKLHSLSSRHLL